VKADALGELNATCGGTACTPVDVNGAKSSVPLMVVDKCKEEYAAYNEIVKLLPTRLT
jgi:hypothetical protein